LSPLSAEARFSSICFFVSIEEWQIHECA
jgi:hypothetical protein